MSIDDLVRRGSGLPLGKFPAGTIRMAHSGAVYNCRLCGAEILVSDLDIPWEDRDAKAAEHVCKA